MTAAAAGRKCIRSTIPARLDGLSWSPFHTRMVAGLGAAWILDGLQITIASLGIVFGINAEGKSLEDVTNPLTSTSETERPPDTVAAPAGV